MIGKGRVRAARRKRHVAGRNERAHGQAHEVVDAGTDDDLRGGAAVFFSQRVA